MSPKIAPANRSRACLLCLLGASGWGSVIVVGFGLLWSYDLTPGPPAKAPAIWPGCPLFEPNPARYCLVLALHPRCPCSRATVAELAEIMSQCGEHLEPHVLFYTPSDAGPDWARTDLQESLAAIQGVTVWYDKEGVQGRRFGATNSGHAALYAPGGHLVFRGGITRLRGHAGDNEGRAAILAHVLNRAVPIDQTAVFGCPLCERRNSEVAQD